MKGDSKSEDWRALEEDETPPEPTPPRKRRFRPFVLLVEAVGGLLAAVLLAGVLLMLRLELGPVEVNWLTPAVVAYLNARADLLTIHIDRTALSWTSGRSTIDLVGSDIRIEDPAGIQIIAVPKLSISLSLHALLRGGIAATRIAVIGPALHLVRNEAGELGVDLGAGTPSAVSEPALAEPPPPLKALLATFAGKREPGAPISYLNQISILRANFTVDDKALGVAWQLSDAELDLTRLTEGVEADLSATIGLGRSTARAYGHFHYDATTRQLAFSTSTDGVDPAKLAEALPAAFAPMKELALPLSAGFGGTLDLAGGQVGPMTVRIDGGAGALIDPHLAGGRLSVTSAGLEAQFDPAEGKLTLGTLRLDLGGPVVAVTGMATKLPPDLLSGGMPSGPVDIAGNVAVRDLPLERLAAIWPPGLSDHAHDWIAANLTVGAIEELHADIGFDLTPGAADKPMQLQRLSGGMNVRNGTIQYMRGLPRIEGADARVGFAPDKLDFTLTSGRLKGLSISSGLVTIDQFGAPFERMTIDLALQGPTRDVLTVLDTKPLSYGKAMGIDVATVEGAVDGTLHFQFPLKNALSFAEVDYGAKAQLTDLAIGKAAFGHDLTAGTMALALDPQKLTLQGNAKIGDVPTELSMRQRLSGTAPPRTEVRAKAVLDDAARQRFNADPLPDRVHGPVATEMLYDDLDGHHNRAVLGLDLAGAAMSIDEFGWQKAPGAAAHADLTLITTDGMLNRIEGLSLKAPDLDLKGGLDFADGKLARADLSRLHVGRTEAVLTVTHQDEPWRIGMHGPVIDMAKMVDRLDKQKDDKPGADKGPAVVLELQGDRVILGTDRELKNVQLSAAVADHTLAAGSLNAAFDKAGKVSFRLDHVEDGGRFALATDDYGALMRLADITDSVHGGNLTVTGDSKPAPEGRRFTGHVEGKDYRFVGAPFMVRLLSLASFASIANLMTGDGIPFTTLKGDFELYDHKLALNHARAYGGAMGVNIDGSIDLGANTLSLDGLLVPAYTLNSVLGNVPLLGDLLTGGEGGGVFSANFRMGGPIDDPKITVNPLSTLAPGMLRRLFLFDAPDPGGSPAPAKP
ncbi:MAG TPA: AsmA-like C-terminal domain-containing protein [Aliidongia sp.]|nr:AsmA-like C-terminal domain-containing protein [Aliidongia sp.]